MDPLHQCLALGPIAVYFTLLGAINLSRRPLLVSGARDAAVLGLALSGLVVVGPLAMLFPDVVAAHLGVNGPRIVWALLVVLYGFTLVLVMLLVRPRLIIYNITADQLRPILADLVDRLDREARWAGDSLMLPRLGIQLHLDATAWMRNVSLVSAGPKQNDPGWARLELSLAAALRHLEVSRNPRGVTLLSIAIFIAGCLAWSIAQDPQAIARNLFDLLRLQ